jgi:hypothetical protein
MAPLGQVTVNLPAILTAADQGARLLGAFAPKLRQIGAPIDAEIARIASSIGDVDPDELDPDDPRLVRGDQLTIANRIHQPAVERQPFGRFPLELTTTDVTQLLGARTAIINAISAVRNEPTTSVQKRLVDRNAFPTFGGTELATLVQEAIRVENLLDIYEAEVLGRSRLKNMNVGVIIGGIAVGLIGLGVISYATRPRKGKRR